MTYVFDTSAVIKGIQLEGDKFIVPRVMRELNKVPDGFRVKATNYNFCQIPLPLFYNYVEDFAIRIQKGLKVAENILESGGDLEDKKRRLRKHWKQDLRSGILDSPADFDTVLLAMELRAILVTVDEGMKKFAFEMGLEVYENKAHY